MLLLMSRTKPPEELTLGSKLSENCPMSRPNFAQYIGNTYICYGVLIKKACNTFRNASIMNLYICDLYFVKLKWNQWNFRLELELGVFQGPNCHKLWNIWCSHLLACATITLCTCVPIMRLWQFHNEQWLRIVSAIDTDTQKGHQDSLRV